MSGYMPQRVFDVGALTIAFIHLKTGERIEIVAQQAFQQYEKSYLDDKILLQWIDATKEALKSLDTLFPNIDKETKIATLVHLKNCVAKYNLDGTKRKKRLLAGTLFNKENEPNHQRVKQFLAHLSTYHLFLQSGKIE